jgi:serine/threonine protein kinase
MNSKECNSKDIDDKSVTFQSAKMLNEKDRFVNSEGQEYICTHRLLGHGTSKVYGGYKCVYKPVAIKKIEVALIEKDKNKKYLKSEIEIMMKLKHDNIVNLLDVIWKNGELHLILERCGGGDFKKFLKEQAMKEDYARFYLKQLAKGLEYLYDNKISHRDLKPQNLLLSDDFNTLKIADFGFAKIIGSENLNETICGSPMYMAPEIMNNESYTDKSDLWSVGIIMFEILFARYPIKDVSNIFELMKALKKFVKVDIPDKPKITNECKNLIFSLLTKDPLKRISWKNFFNHPWFKMIFTKKQLSSTKSELKKSSTKQLTDSLSSLYNDQTDKDEEDENSLFKFEEDLGNKSTKKMTTFPISISPNDTRKHATVSAFNPETMSQSIEKEMSFHLNSTSPFVKSYNPVKFNIIDDYSSTDVLPIDSKFKHYSSAPTKHSSMSTLKNPDRKAYSMINVRREDDFISGIRGKTIREEEESKNNLSKTMKGYAYASYSLLKDSFKSL